MFLLNYLYFFIITYYGIKFLFQPSGIMKNPLNKEQDMLLNGPEMFWILTFSTGLLAFSAPGALDLMAVRLLVLEILCFIGLFIAKGRAIWGLPFVLYVIYLIWIITGIFYSRLWIPSLSKILLSTSYRSICVQRSQEQRSFSESRNRRTMGSFCHGHIFIYPSCRIPFISGCYLVRYSPCP